jgi:hypothetical protein
VLQAVNQLGEFSFPHNTEKVTTMMKELTSKAVSRRSLLTGVALAGAGIALGACSAAQVQTFETQWATIAGQIQQAVAKAAAYIPTIETIAATAASLFGPEYVALIQVGTAAFNQIVATLTNVVNSLSPPASARLAARLATSSALVPVTIGVTPANIKVVGWHA